MSLKNNERILEIASNFLEIPLDSIAGQLRSDHATIPLTTIAEWGLLISHLNNINRDSEYFTSIQNSLAYINAVLFSESIENRADSLVDAILLNHALWEEFINLGQKERKTHPIRVALSLRFGSGVSSQMATANLPPPPPPPIKLPENM